MRNKKKFISIVLAVLFVVSIFSACSSGAKLQDENGNALSSSSNYPVSVFGVQFDEAPKAVVSLSDSITDILYALKYDNLLVGRSDTSTISYTQDLPRVGTTSQLNVDALVSLGVDFVLSDEPLLSKQISELNSKNIKFLSFSAAKTFDELQSIYTNLGAILGGAKDGYEAAYKKSNDIFITIENINKLITPSSGNTVCYMYDGDGTVATGDTLFSQLITLAGGTNVAADYTNYYMPKDDILKKNPAYIFCPSTTKARLESDPFYKTNLWALNNSRVYEMSSNMADYQGSTLIDAMTLMASVMSPDLLTKTQTNTASSQAASSVASEQSPSQTVSSQAQSSQPSSSQASSSQSSASSTVAPGTVLQLGDTGEEVTRLQTRLKELGHAYMDPTGTFDEDTEEAVKNFQYLSDFNATGIATEAVLNALYSSDAVTGPNL